MSKEIQLFGKFGEGLYALVDDEDYDRVNQHRWHVGNNGYIKTFVGGRKNAKCILMHRLIMNPSEDLEVDHRDGNKLDNRRSNLRVAERSQNARNLRRHKKFSSRFKGVSWNAARYVWEAELTFDNHPVYLGQFASEIQAAQAYNDGALRYFGEFASLNIINKDTPDDVRYRQGKAIKSSRTSKYRGVSFCKKRHAWTADIQVNGQRFRLGGFATEEEAAREYDRVALEQRGSVALLNFPNNIALTRR